MSLKRHKKNIHVILFHHFALLQDKPLIKYIEACGLNMTKGAKVQGGWIFLSGISVRYPAADTPHFLVYFGSYIANSLIPLNYFKVVVFFCMCKYTPLLIRKAVWREHYCCYPVSSALRSSKVPWVYTDLQRWERKLQGAVMHFCPVL